MSTATLYRSVYKAAENRYDPDLRYLGEEVVFHGELEGAIAAARALPIIHQAEVSLATEHGTFRYYDFDNLADGWEPAARDISYGRITVRVTKDALLLMHGERLRYIRSTALLDGYVDAVRDVVRRKEAAKEFEVVEGRRILIIDASDLL